MILYSDRHKVQMGICNDYRWYKIKRKKEIPKSHNITGKDIVLIFIQIPCSLLLIQLNILDIMRSNCVPKRHLEIAHHQYLVVIYL